ncbi:hybrid sensor histidine kinase/response regulator [Shewanella sedimentimangrovi]|uniref:histidine kinase n=1 Tax=Shewanella sedimentimangrovi TaxID=2814293 RepID=A0ABX7R0M0_9GAMM|nr:ATP-binding protein [Shewanella sedimentimangrovi]QSX37336.1 response regulator [Shewanella sedimentimangrovi]
MMSLMPRESIAYKLNLATLFCALLVCLLVSLYYLNEVDKRIRSQADLELTDLVGALNLALETQADQANMQRVAGALAARSSIFQLSIINADTLEIVADNHIQHQSQPMERVLDGDSQGLVRSVTGEASGQQRYSKEGQIFQAVLVYLISPEVQRLRPYVVFIGYDPEPIRSEAMEELVDYIAIQLLGFALLLLINLYTQRKYVLKPIGRIASQIAAHGTEHTLSLDNKDEFGLLVESYNAAIRERLQQQQELEDSRRYIDSVINVIPVQLAYVDAERRYRFINSRYLQLLQKTEDEVLGKKVAEVLPPELEETVRPHQLQALAGRRQEFETESTNEQGQTQFVQVTYMPDVDASGTVVGFFSCIEDLTAIKLNELKIENYARELEFHNLALSEASEKAESAARAKADFLACMSHEIRTPMNGVIGILSLLARTELSAQQQHYVDVASSSAESLLSLLNDILDFSKIESGKFEIETLRFDLIQLLDEFVQPMALKAEEKRLHLLLDVTAVGHRWLLGDPGRLRQVLFNLVGNAIKFTQAGWIAIRVSSEAETDKQVRVRIAIEDTGIGIPAAKLAQLFNPFTQADSSTTRHFGGTGLGLSIARRLCELMQGDIRASSVEHVGSTFEFNVLLAVSETPADRHWPPELQGRLLLLGGDCGANETVLAELLQSWGADVKVLPGRQTVAASPELSRAKGFIYSLPPQSPVSEEIQWLTSLACDQATKSLAVVSHEQHLQLLPSANKDHVAVLCRPLSLFSLMAWLGLEELPEPLRDGGNDDIPVVAGQPRVLLVEDNRVNQMVAMGLLHELGLEADLAVNGLEALDKLQLSNEGHFQAVLMDCLMPAMDGYQTTAMIRRGEVGEHWRHIPIIAMTANAMKGDREHCLESGMDDYICKPLIMSVVRQVLGRWLGGMPLPKVAESNAPQTREGALFDREAMLKLMSGDPGLLNEILAVFVDEMRHHRAAFLQAMDDQDFPGIRASAHSIKGAAANLGMTPLANMARRMEVAARERQRDILSLAQDEFLQILDDTLVACQCQEDRV